MPLTAENARRWPTTPTWWRGSRAFGSVYFTGGDQAKIVAALAPARQRDAGARGDPRGAGGGRPRRRLERRRGDDVAADDPRRHLDRVGRPRHHRGSGAAGPADGHRARLLSLRHRRPALHQARPARAARRRDGGHRRAARLRHRREHRAARRGRGGPGLRRIRGDGRRHRPGRGRRGRAQLPRLPPELPRRRRRASTSPASGRSPARPSGGCGRARSPTARRRARGATSSPPTRSTT